MGANTVRVERGKRPRKTTLGGKPREPFNNRGKTILKLRFKKKSGPWEKHKTRRPKIGQNNPEWGGSRKTDFFHIEAPIHC